MNLAAVPRLAGRIATGADAGYIPVTTALVNCIERVMPPAISTITVSTMGHSGVKAAHAAIDASSRNGNICAILRRAVASRCSDASASAAPAAPEGPGRHDALPAEFGEDRR